MDKNQLIQSIRTERRQLERYLFYFEKTETGDFRASGKLKFSVEELSQPGVMGDWSIKDLLANLTAWEKFLQLWLGKSSANTLNGLPDQEFLQNIDSHENQQIYQMHRKDAMEQVLSEFYSSFAHTIHLISLVSEDELFRPYSAGQGEKTLADTINMCTAVRYSWAKQALRRMGKIHQQTIITKDSLLQDIQQERQRLETLINGIPPHLLIDPGIVGEWSVKDIMAHLAAWEQLFLNWYRTGLEGETPQIPAPGFTWKQMGKLNRMIFESHRDQELAEVKSEFDTSYQVILREIAEMTEEMISTPGYFSWTGGYNLQGYIRANTANHYRWAKNQIRRWLNIKKSESYVSGDS